jgi:competence protein ComEA
MDDLVARARKYFTQVSTSKKLLALVFVVICALATMVGTLSSSGSQTIPAPSGNPAGSAVVHSPTFYVHVVGRVKVPGVYELEVGSRLFDAVVAAGGFMEDADQASVNLARPLSDGEQVIILKLGDQPNNVGSHSGANAQISLNRASESELESLPGVGPALANRIIDWRTANGGFKRKEDLLQVGGIGSKLFASLEKLVSL